MRSPFSILLLAAALGACHEYRVEYHKRPEFYQKASVGVLPDEITLDDGTVVKYQSVEGYSSLGRGKTEKGKPFEIREEHQDGSVTLRALLPEHVLMNTLTCLQKEEYKLLYDQMLSERTKMAYEQEGKGLDDFTSFFRTHRHDLAATLSRMIAGMNNNEVSVTNLDAGLIRCKIRQQNAEPFKFKTVDVVKEEVGLKLLIIR